VVAALSIGGEFAGRVLQTFSIAENASLQKGCKKAPAFGQPRLCR
jgi:hypothetical protein